MSNYIDAQYLDDYSKRSVRADDIILMLDDGINDPKVEVACAQATDIIDRLKYIGEPATEENAFPRDGQIEVPKDIKQAACEIALSLLDGVDPEMEFEGLTQSFSRFEQVQITSDTKAPAQHLAVGVPSSTAWNLLVPWLKRADGIELSRV